MLKQNLEAEGYEVEIVNRGDGAEIRLQDNLPDLLVLDWMLPMVPGMELCRRLRERPATERLPIIMLTARGDQTDRMREPSTGVDDYLVKPVTTSELIARVRALLRRTRPEVLSDVLVVRDITLDRRQHQVFRKGRPIKLGMTEFRLLEFMMQHPGRVFSREQLLDGVWGNSLQVDGRAVDTNIVRLRKSLKANRVLDLVRTIRGEGYAIGQEPDVIAVGR